ncbi:MAG: TIGR00266 family protein [Myxococcota bacterium]|nr:TIGR00266 family protein [Myxococcota bacterium]
MNIEILCRPAASSALVKLNQGEELTAEVGAMIAMSPNLRVETTSRHRGAKGGIMKGIKRIFSGENFFLNHFTAAADDQELYIGPALMGDICTHNLRSETLIIQGSSWLASGTGIEVDTTFQGFGAALFSGESVFWVKCSGQGVVILNSFGAIYEIDVDGEYIVDTGHIVAFEDTLNFNISKAGSSWVSSFLGGEGLVCRFKGQGKLYCQTHNPPSFGQSLTPKLRPRQA